MSTPKFTGGADCFAFTNGAQVSVIDYGYGSAQGLFEVAFSDVDASELAKVETETAIAVHGAVTSDDVIGWLDLDEVNEILTLVESL